MSSPVTLHVYDLSQGMAAQMSPGLLGKQIGGIWHTGIVAFGREYYFGGGICVDAPNTTPYGLPKQTHALGSTSRTQEEFLSFLRSIGHRFTVATYHLLDNNCNNFSDECARFLTGKGIPPYIVDLPKEVMATPFGQMFRPMIDSMQGTIRDASMGHELNLSSAGDASTPTHSALHSLAKSRIRLEKINRDAVVKKFRELDPSAEPESVLYILDFLERAQAEVAFPALDLLRIMALESTNAALMVERLPSILDKFVTSNDTTRPSLMMALRVAVNVLCSDAAAETVVREAQDVVVEACARGLEHDNAQVRLAAGALCLNLSIACTSLKVSLSESSAVRLVCCIGDRLNSKDVAESEASQLIGALGLLVSTDEDAKILAKTMEINTLRFAQSKASELAMAARDVSELIAKASG
mmetsp:Transcript_6369/g.19258  ORF Transcript_6369/g.19258 Transcript_6369/m.19258 type:complete len:412 (+) Transcript_6369:45-1280(+)